MTTNTMFGVNAKYVTDTSGNVTGLVGPDGYISYLTRHKPMGLGGRFRLTASNERGSSGTYHTTFRAAGDFVAVQPIINVTRAPTDATYTSDDVYDQIAVAPSAAVLTGGYPDASGGAAAWTASANMTFARQTGASTSTPIPVLGNMIYCSSIARADGGPGRLLMARAYSTGSGHASAATTRMPTYYDEQTSLTKAQRWDDATNGFPLSGHGQHYYRSGNYASTSQDTFGSGATRWQHTCFAGMKFHYTKPCTTVMGVGDSIMGADYDETGIPIRASYLWRAVYAMQTDGHMIDDVNLGGSGYRWDQFGPWMQRIVPVFLPEIVLLPVWTPNGTASGVGTGNTQADADKHWAQAMYYREWALANGVKEVILVTPAPKSGSGTVIAAAKAYAMDSGLPVFDLLSAAGDSETAWKSGYSTDGTHLNAAGNAAISAALKAVLRGYL